MVSQLNKLEQQIQLLNTVSFSEESSIKQVQELKLESILPILFESLKSYIQQKSEPCLKQWIDICLQQKNQPNYQKRFLKTLYQQSKVNPEVQFYRYLMGLDDCYEIAKIYLKIRNYLLVTYFAHSQKQITIDNMQISFKQQLNISQNIFDYNNGGQQKVEKINEILNEIGSHESVNAIVYIKICIIVSQKINLQKNNARKSQMSLKSENVSEQQQRKSIFTNSLSKKSILFDHPQENFSFVKKISSKSSLSQTEQAEKDKATIINLTEQLKKKDIQLQKIRLDVKQLIANSDLYQKLGKEMQSNLSQLVMKKGSNSTIEQITQVTSYSHTLDEYKQQKLTIIESLKSNEAYIQQSKVSDLLVKPRTSSASFLRFKNKSFSTESPYKLKSVDNSSTINVSQFQSDSKKVEKKQPTLMKRATVMYSEVNILANSPLVRNLMKQYQIVKFRQEIELPPPLEMNVVKPTQKDNTSSIKIDYEAVGTFISDDPRYLKIINGEQIIFFSKQNGWYIGQNEDGEVGYFASTYVGIPLDQNSNQNSRFLQESQTLSSDESVQSDE